MNTLPTTLAWCVLQVTLLAIFVAFGCAALRKGTPAIRALAVFTGLVLVMFLTVVSFAPWPGWSVTRLSERAAPPVPNPEVSRQQDSPPARTEDAAQPEDATQPEVAGQPDIATAVLPTMGTEAPDSSAPHQPTPALLFWESLAAELQVPPADAPAATPRWTWPMALALVVFVGMAIGLARLLAGLMIVRSYRAKSRPVADPKLLELRDIVQAELGCPRQIKLLESDLLATAATVGWRKPLVLLPANWREWSDDERRAVLAHEIAHIQRDDFLTWVTAQGALVLHFYHPLVHWLCGRLRLEQELAADAAAAGVTGGQTAYLTTLAAMALRQADRPVAWPARTFLPTRGTFMRRIEMLRGTKLRSATTSLGVRGGTVAVLLVAGVLISGLRGVDGQTDSNRVSAAPPVEEASVATPPGKTDEVEVVATEAESEPVVAVLPATDALTEFAGIEYVPRDAAIIARLRPGVFLARPGMARFVQLLKEQEFLRPLLGIGLDRVEEVTLMMLPAGPAERMAPTNVGWIVVAKEAEDIAGLIRLHFPKVAEEEYGDRKYFKRVDGPPAFYLPVSGSDRIVVIVNDEGALRRTIVASTTDGFRRSKWSYEWEQVARHPAALFVNIETLRDDMDQLAGSFAASTYNLTAALWLKPDALIAGLRDLQRDMELKGSLMTGSAKDLQLIRAALNGFLTLVKKDLAGMRAATSRVADKSGAALLTAADIAESALEKATVIEELDYRRVRFSTEIPNKDAALLAALLLPAISNSRAVTQQVTAKNNLKQIGLAMHNFHDVFKHFPPAVLYGASGNGKSKYPHSWRVALLPFLNHADLYQQYKFDEPWDSESNRKLLAQMPAVYRDPSAPANATNSSYFVFVGAQAIDGMGEGMVRGPGAGAKKSGPADRDSVATARVVRYSPTTPFWITAPDTVSKGTQFGQMTDGTSNTFLVVEAKRDVPWTKPDDIPYVADKPLPELGGYRTGGFLALFGDGRVELLSDKIDEKTLRALITMNDGMAVDLDKITIRDGR